MRRLPQQDTEKKKRMGGRDDAVEPNVACAFFLYPYLCAGMMVDVQAGATPVAGAGRKEQAVLIVRVDLHVLACAQVGHDDVPTNDGPPSSFITEHPAKPKEKLEKQKRH